MIRSTISVPDRRAAIVAEFFPAGAFAFVSDEFGCRRISGTVNGHCPSFKANSIQN